MLHARAANIRCDGYCSTFWDFGLELNMGSYTCVVLSHFRLPGEAFVRRVHVWLCGANKVDSKVFSRAILARVHIPSPFFSIFFFKERCRSWYMVMVIKDAGYVVLLQQYSMTKDKLMIVVEL